jgi:hypothetical protein
MQSQYSNIVDSDDTTVSITLSIMFELSNM